MAARNREERTPVTCSSCGKQRMLLHPELAGSMCQACAALIGSQAAAKLSAPAVDRFNSSYEESDSGCWLWTGTIQPNGYSSFYFEGRTVRGHRWSYEHFIGPIPDGLQIDHRCHKPSDCQLGDDCPHRRCVNPDHLEPVPHRENSRRAMRSHCVNGHELTPENTYIPADGKRYCRECRRRRVREYRERRRDVA